MEGRRIETGPQWEVAMRTIRDVMRGDIEVLRTTETAADAACFLATHSEDAVPLCLNDGSLAGMVSNRDIVAQVVAKGRDPREVSLAEFAGASRRGGARRRRPPRGRRRRHVPAPPVPAAGARGRSRRRLRHPARRRPLHQLPAALGRQLTDPSRAPDRPGPSLTGSRPAAPAAVSSDRLRNGRGPRPPRRRR